MPGTSRVLARWADGYEEHLQAVQLELWPEFKEGSTKASGSTAGLPKNGSKKKKKQKAATAIWDGVHKCTKATLTLAWRSSRGWLLSLSTPATSGGKTPPQLTHIKPDNYMLTDSGGGVVSHAGGTPLFVQGRCIDLMGIYALRSPTMT